MNNPPSALRTRSKLMIAAMASMPGLLWAEGYGDTDTKVCGFLSNITGLLNMGSIAVVTIAVIFAGYQIAFAHKRIGDVAPILIGGLLIGAAGQIAKMVIGDDGDQQCQQAGMLLANQLMNYA
jgi:type IV secretion system protein VirB2